MFVHTIVSHLFCDSSELVYCIHCTESVNALAYSHVTDNVEVGRFQGSHLTG